METVQNTLAENLGGPFHRLATGDKAFSLDQVPDLNGKVALVTGGSEGIGFGCTHTLLSHNISKLFILTKSEEKMEDGLDAIEKDLGRKARDSVVWKQCDLADWEGTAKVATEVSQETDRLDILINNAGRGIMSQQFGPKNGIDLHMACNHMGHVVLTSHLLPLMKKTAESGSKVRIVNLSSSLHQSAPSDVAFANLDELQKDYGPNPQYGRSKLAVLLHAKYLSRHLTSKFPNIVANATHPGIVDTDQTNKFIHEPYPLLGYGMSVGMKPFRKSVFDGCVSTMYAATTCEDSGLYIAPPKIVGEGDPKANDMELAETLMKLTKELVDEKSGASKQGCPLNMC